MNHGQSIPQKAGNGKGQLTEAWSAYLQQFSWDHFSTFTFRPIVRPVGLNRQEITYIHPESVQKALRRLINELNKEIFGQRYWKRPHEGIIVAAAMERQQSGNPHVHALMGNIPSRISRKGIESWWFEKQGIARVKEYKHGMGAEEYLSKLAYLFKDGQVEIDLLGPLEHYQPAPRY